MKKNKMMRIASVLLVAVLLSTCAISGTFAKYTSAAAASATAKVAKWDVTVDGNALNATTKAFTFNLFDTIVDTTSGNPKDPAADKAVAEGHIAPGTQGSYDIVINNNSEVDVNFTVALETPAEFEDIITFNVNTTGGSLNSSQTVTVSWNWPYNGDDAKDLELGVLGLENYDIIVTITVTQVD